MCSETFGNLRHLEILSKCSERFLFSQMGRGVGPFSTCKLGSKHAEANQKVVLSWGTAACSKRGHNRESSEGLVVLEVSDTRTLESTQGIPNKQQHDARH